MTLVARLTGIGTFLAYDFDETTVTKFRVGSDGTAYSNEFDENTATTLSGSKRMSATSTGGLIVYDSINEIDPIDVIPTSGLQLYLDSGNASSYSGSGTTWTDLSGNGRTGTLTNGPTYSASSGGILNFDGDNDYVVISGYKGITGTGARTSIIRFKSNLTNDFTRFFGWGGITAAGNKWVLNSDITNYRLSLGTAGGAFVTGNTSTPNIVDGKWHTVAATVGASQTVNDVKLYVDGNLLTDVTYGLGSTAINTLSSADVSIAASLADTTPENLNGSVSQVLIYNRQLSDLEIKIVHRSILNRY